MNDEAPAADSPPGPAAVVMACLPTALAVVFLFLAESVVDASWGCRCGLSMDSRAA